MQPLLPSTTSAGCPADAPERADPQYLWRDLLRVHSAFHMHLLIGGGGPLRWVLQMGGRVKLHRLP